MSTVPEQMLAAVLPSYGADLKIVELPIPRPSSGEVLIKVTAAGVCHSDLHLIDGDPAVLPRFPWTLGHEVAGEVLSVGPGTTGVDIGELVAVFGASRRCRSVC